MLQTSEVVEGVKEILQLHFILLLERETQLVMLLWSLQDVDEGVEDLREVEVLQQLEWRSRCWFTVKLDLQFCPCSCLPSLCTCERPVCMLWPARQSIDAFTPPSL